MRAEEVRTILIAAVQAIVPDTAATSRDQFTPIDGLPSSDAGATDRTFRCVPVTTPSLDARQTRGTTQRSAIRETTFSVQVIYAFSTSCDHRMTQDADLVVDAITAIPTGGQLQTLVVQGGYVAPVLDDNFFVMTFNIAARYDRRDPA